MHIGITLNPYGEKKPSGLGVFILNVTLALVKARPDWHFTIFVRGDQTVTHFAQFLNVSIVCLPDNPFWKDLAILRYRSIDLWMYLNPSLPFIFTPRKSIIIVPDLSIHHDTSRSIKKYLLKIIHRWSFVRATHTIAISHATKKDVHYLFPSLADESVSVAMCGYTPVAIQSADPKNPVGSDYYLLVGVLKSRKNQLTALEAFISAKKKGLNAKLVIVGKGENDYSALLASRAGESGFAQDIIFKGYVTDAELVTLYAHARALVFPSHIEGFGMVLVEAMSCGVPVISSSNSAQGEVANGYAYTVDSHDIEGFATGMLAFQDEQVREQFRKKGLERAQHFSWEKSAETYVSIISNKLTT